MPVSMAFIRPIIILLLFFGLLFAFRVPLQDSTHNFQVAVINPAKEFLQELAGATSSISGYEVFSKIGGDNKDAYSSKDEIASTTKKTESGTVQSGISVSVDRLPPVKSNSASFDSSALTVQGIIDGTNVERTKKGIQSLAHNKTLDKSAEAKLEDMFSKQYFEHVSPAGTSISDVVTKAGYNYIVVGENLALGNFGGDKNVMLAWMNSPGHRANILDGRFQEIGVAVGRGMYEGKMQWLAVQHFGKPISACPNVDSQLKSSIDATQENLNQREQQIEDLRALIDTSTPDNSSYQNYIQQYNELVKEYNRRLDSFKTAVDQYNQSVQLFNACAGLSK